PPPVAARRVAIPRIGERTAPANAAVARQTPATRARKAEVPQTPAASTPKPQRGAQRAPVPEPKFRRRDSAPRAGDVVRFRGEKGAYRLTPIDPKETNR
uniref:hypothetical protein n=1 Tax=Microbacterium lacticum TaxID=33885 RepID=UPI0028D24C95